MLLSHLWNISALKAFLQFFKLKNYITSLKSFFSHSARGLHGFLSVESAVTPERNMSQKSLLKLMDKLLKQLAKSNEWKVQIVK